MKLYSRILGSAIIILLNIVSTAVHADFDKYHFDNFPKDVAMQPQLFPLSFIGADGIYQIGRSDIQVKFVEKNGIGDKGGLKAGDLIIAAGGKEFTEAKYAPMAGSRVNEGPKVILGDEIENAINSKDKTLRVKVIRNNKKVELKFNLSSRSAYTKNYPFYCMKSDKAVNDICEYFIKKQHPSGSFENGSFGYLTPVVGLMLLSTGEKKYLKNIKGIANYYVEKGEFKLEGWIWPYLVESIFLSEYYLATQDESVLEAIKYRSDSVALMATSDDGRHSHHFSKEPGYKGSGLNIISTQALLVWELAQKCGLTIHKKQYDATLKQLIESSGPQGGVGYAGTSGENAVGGVARTGVFTIALHLSGKHKKLLKKHSKQIERSIHHMNYDHTTSLMGMIWGPAALSCTNKKGLRKHFDYWRWFMYMGETPKGNKLKRYFIPGPDNNYTESKAGKDDFNHAVIALMLSIYNKNLFIHGNVKANWFNKRTGESLISFYSKTIKGKKELLEYVDTEFSRFTEQNELGDTLKFIKREIGRHNGKAEVLYEKCIKTITDRVADIQKLSYVNPVKAYHYSKQFEKIIRNDRQLYKLIKNDLSALWSDRKVQQLYILKESFENSTTNITSATKAKLEVLRRKLEQYISVNFKNRILCANANIIIERLDRFIEKL